MASAKPQLPGAEPSPGAGPADDGESDRDAARERGVNPGSERDPTRGIRRIRSVGAIIFDTAGRLLLIQRGHAPAKGQWSVPGGKVEPGESDGDAVIREVAEETGLAVKVGALAGMIERAGGPGIVYEIYDYDAVLVDSDSASARAASDAADLRWVAPGDLDSLPLTDGLIEALRRWGRLP